MAPGGPRGKVSITDPHKFMSRGQSLLTVLSKFLVDHYEKTHNWVFERSLVVLEEKCQIPTPYKFGSRGPSLLTEIEISCQPL